MMIVISTLLISILVLAAPWPVAGNYPFARTAFLAVSSMLLAIAAIQVYRGQMSIKKIHFALLGIAALGLGWTAFQTVPFLGWAGSWPVLYQPPNGSLGMESRNSISIYPAATRESLVDFLIGVATFVSCTFLLQRRREIHVVMFALALVGVGVAFLGILQAVAWNGQIYWRYELLNGGRAFASFVNRNNAAGMLLTSLAGAIFLVARQLLHWRATRFAEPELIIDSQPIYLRKNKLLSGVTEVLARLESRHLYSWLGLLVIVAGVFVSLSRGGLLAMVLMLVVAGFAFSRERRWLAVVLGVLVIISGFVFLRFTDQLAAFAGRMESLTLIAQESTPRLEHWNDMRPMFESAWMWGAGAGTYRLVSPYYQTFDTDRVYAHAENAYLEIFAELGVVGLACVLIALVLMLNSGLALIRQSDPFDRSLGIAGTSGIVGTAVACFFDFGILQPANMVLFAVFAGGLVGRHSFVKRDIVEHQHPLAQQAVLLVMALSLLIATGWGLYESQAIESVRWARRQIELAKEHRNPSDLILRTRSLNQLQSCLEHAIGCRPDDAEAFHQLGELLVLRYRKTKSNQLNHEIQQALHAANVSMEEKQFWEAYSPEQIWASSALASLHREIHLGRRNHELDIVQLLISDDAVASYLAPAFDAYRLAAERLPRGKTELRLAQLAPLYEPERETEFLDASLNQPFPSAQRLFDAGFLFLNQGRQARAAELWSACLSKPATNAFEKPIVELAMTDLSMQLLFEQVLPQSPDALIGIVKKYFLRPQLILPKRLLLIHTEQVLSKVQESLSKPESFYYQAEIDRLSERFDQAAENYQRALDLEPDQVVWRFHYAQCLHMLGRYDEAILAYLECQSRPSPIYPQIEGRIRRVRADRKANQASPDRPTTTSQSDNDNA